MISFIYPDSGGGWNGNEAYASLSWGPVTVKYARGVSGVIEKFGRLSLAYTQPIGEAWKLQVGLGISNVLLNLPLAVAVAHNGGGAALLLVLVLVNYRLRQPAHAARQTEPASISNTTGQLDLPRA